jgi:tryptophanyl-tRNA synthetase
VLNEEEMQVTPWEVHGKVDYDRLTEQFGTEPLTLDILEKIRRYTKELHPQLRRRIFFSHRDLDWILDMYEQGHQFVLYTGRGPSGPVHIGHIVPWIFTKHLQDRFGSKLYFQMTDDEKFLIDQEMLLSTSTKWAYDNALDVIAIGFDPKKTQIIIDANDIYLLYKLALEISKHITFSTAKAVFGFEDSSNIGIIFFPAIQAAPAFLESYLTGVNVPCLIPAAIDQDPYWRIARDVAPKLGYFKPAQIHSRFLPALERYGKMSASLPETCIFTTDSPEVATRKVMRAFTGGRATVQEQRRLGANPDICSVYQYEFFLFMEDDDEIWDLRRKCLSGEILCGECKNILAERVSRFLKNHQEKREKAKDQLDRFLLKMR